MCRRFQLLYNISQATANEIVDYLYKMWKIYIILLAISIVTLVFNHRDFVWSISTLVLYAINVVAFYALVNSPSSFVRIYLAMMSAFFLACLNTVEMVSILVLYQTWLSLLRIIAIAIHLTTIYIIYKLREKLKHEETGDLESAHNVIHHSPNSTKNVIIN
jgi:hypothetical protein